MAPRKPKNLFGDLADATSAWLGGLQPVLEFFCAQ